MAFLDIFGFYYFKINLVIFTITNFFAACEECLKVLMVVTKFAKQSSIVAFFAVFCSYISKEIKNNNKLFAPPAITFILDKYMTK